jgi:hypothetical protein
MNQRDELTQEELAEQHAQVLPVREAMSAGATAAHAPSLARDRETGGARTGASHRAPAPRRSPTRPRSARGPPADARNHRSRAEAHEPAAVPRWASPRPTPARPAGRSAVRRMTFFSHNATALPRLEGSSATYSQFRRPRDFTDEHWSSSGGSTQASVKKGWIGRSVRNGSNQFSGSSVTSCLAASSRISSSGISE